MPTSRTKRKSAAPQAPSTPKAWRLLAERRLQAILKRAQVQKPLVKQVSSLIGKGSRGPRPLWSASIKFADTASMTRLNTKYRGKRYATDVLSFSVPAIFLEVGYLGEMVICLPVLKRQARERGHAQEAELEVLLVHGILHLIGLDHELGPKQAAQMARWEAVLLPARLRGLIGHATHAPR